MKAIELLRYLSTRLAVSSQRRRFLSFAKAVAFISVMLGSAAMVICLSVLAGFDDALHTLAESFTSHIQVRSRAAMSLGEKSQFIKQISRTSGSIVRVDEIATSNALIYSHGTTEGIILKSVPMSVWSRSDEIHRRRPRIKAGKKSFTELQVNEVAVGARLAARLSCSAGDTLLVTTSASDPDQFSSFDVIPVRVGCVYESGMTQYDDVVVYAPFAFCQSIIDTVHTMSVYAEVWLQDRSQLASVTAAISESFRYAVECVTVEDLHRGMFSWIEIQKRPIPLVIALISIVAVFNIVTTLLISIVEKTHTYAVLQTLGLSGRAVIGLVCWQGLRLGFFGSTMGCALAAGALYLQQTYSLIHLDGAIYFVDTVPVLINPVHSIIVVVVASSISVLATLIPGIIASRFSPVAALRFR